MADLKVRVEVDEKVGYVGGPRAATVTVRNIGTDPVDDVELTATWSDLVLPSVAPPLPPETPDCLPAGNSCDLGTIAGGRQANSSGSRWNRSRRAPPRSQRR